MTTETGWPISAGPAPATRNGYVTPPCLVCGQPVPTGRTRTTCSDACRQAAWRRRHQPHAAAPPELPRSVPKKPSTVYECPECGERLLGVFSRPSVKDYVNAS